MDWRNGGLLGWGSIHVLRKVVEWRNCYVLYFKNIGCMWGQWQGNG